MSLALSCRNIMLLFEINQYSRTYLRYRQIAMSLLSKFNIYKTFEFEMSPFQIEYSKIVWLSRLRWVVTSIFFILSVPLYFNQFLNRQQFVIYVGLISILSLANFFTSLLYSERKKDIPTVAVFYQLTLDLIVATSLLLVSGSFSNPFCMIIFLNTFISGLLLSRTYSTAFLFLVHSCIGVLQIFNIHSQNINFNDRTVFVMIIFHFINVLCWFLARLIGHFFKKQNDLYIQQAHSIEKLNRLKAVGALAAGFSHEFASPLTAAKLSLDRVIRNLDQVTNTENLKHDLVLAAESLQACENVVDQMNTSQMDVRSFSFKKVKIKELLVDIIDSWKEENPEAKILNQIEGEEFAVVPVINFAQVVLNLLDNAYHAARSEPIDVILNVQNQFVELNICDRGPGFSKDILNRVGEPFVTTKPSGHGLGLYVADLFAESLGGKLNLSNTASGAQVKIIWPNNESILT